MVKRNNNNNQNNQNSQAPRIQQIEGQLQRITNMMRNIQLPSLPVQPTRRRRNRRARGRVAIGDTRAVDGTKIVRPTAIPTGGQRFIQAARTQAVGRFRELMPEHMGRNAESGLWVYKYLHPCSDQVIGVPRGIPDETSCNVTSFELRNLLQIPAPNGLASGSKWGCIMYLTNFPEYPVMYRAFTEGATVGTPLNIWGLFSDIRAAGWAVMPANGMVGQFNATVASTSGAHDAIFNVPISGRRYSKFRTMYKGVTIHLNANALSDEGMTTVAQTGASQSESVDIPILYDNLDVPFDPNLAIKYVDIQMVPHVDESVMLNQGVSSINWNAKEGVYVQQRFNEPVNAIKYKDAADGYPDFAPGSIVTTYPVEGLLLANTWRGPASDSEVPFAYRSRTNATDNGGSQTGGTNYWISHQSAMQPAYAIFRGLNGAATLNVKAIEGIEAQMDLTRQGDGALHAHKAPAVDEYATKLATMVSAEVSGIYQACDNDFSDVIRRISGVVRDVGSVLSGFLPGPWGVGAKAVSMAAGGINAAFGG